MINNIITVNEAADQLKVTPRRVLQYIDEGTLRAKRFGGKSLMINQEDLDKFQVELKERRAARGVVR
jgi:excisionase family DNA binding protein